MNYWVVIYRVALGIVIFVVAVATVCSFIPKIERYQEFHRKRSDSQEEVRHIRDEVKKYREKQDRFATEPAFVEHTAREVGMAKPDETVFKYSNEAVTTEAETNKTGNL